MFRSSTIRRELVQSLAEVIFLWKHSVKLCQEPELETESAQQKAHTPFHDMLPHLHTIYNDVIFLNVLTEV